MIDSSVTLQYIQVRIAIGICNVCGKSKSRLVNIYDTINNESVTMHDGCFRDVKGESDSVP